MFETKLLGLFLNMIHIAVYDASVYLRQIDISFHQLSDNFRDAFKTL